MTIETTAFPAISIDVLVRKARQCFFWPCFLIFLLCLGVDVKIGLERDFLFWGGGDEAVTKVGARCGSGDSRQAGIWGDLRKKPL